jgi:hypothetical protein
MFHQAFKKIDDVFWIGAGCTTELDYMEYARERPREKIAAVLSLNALQTTHEVAS